MDKITIIFTHDDDGTWIAESKDFDIRTFGNTMDEAFKNIKDELTSYIQDLFEMDALGKFLDKNDALVNGNLEYVLKVK